MTGGRSEAARRGREDAARGCAGHWTVEDYEEIRRWGPGGMVDYWRAVYAVDPAQVPSNLRESARAPLPWPVTLAFAGAQALAYSLERHSARGRAGWDDVAFAASWFLQIGLRELRKEAELRRARSLGFRHEFETSPQVPSVMGIITLVGLPITIAVGVLRRVRGRHRPTRSPARAAAVSLAITMGFQALWRFQWRRAGSPTRPPRPAPFYPGGGRRR